MKLLLTDLLPMGIDEGQLAFSVQFEEEIKKSDRIDIAVGYVSSASLDKLDRIIRSLGIRYVTLIIGMYFVEGMPEGSYHKARTINRSWLQEGIGEVRIVKPFKFHGKAYVFYYNTEVFSVILGSANLGAIQLEASNRRQYEVNVQENNTEFCREVANLLEKLKAPLCSENIEYIDDMSIISEVNSALDGIAEVKKVPQSDIELYGMHLTTTRFDLPIKVPRYSERFMDDGNHYTKSNINVCYAAPRSLNKVRDWYWSAPSLCTNQ